MEQAIAAVDLGRYRRILQMFWDPEPTNDRERNVPVWCLGCQYTLTKSPPAGREAPASSQRRGDGATTPPSQDYVKPEVPVGEPGPSSSPSAAGLSAAAVTPTPPDSASSSFDSSLAYDSSSPASGASSGADDGGWPPAFLDDFESRIWMTYRSEFASIPRSTDPRAVLALSMTMRIKSQLLVDQNGFSSDSGWGCMIRSGQSLLANAMLVNRLGRGMLPLFPSRGRHVPMCQRLVQNGDEVWGTRKNDTSSRCSPTTLERPSQYTTLLITAQEPAESIPASGLGRPRRRDASGPSQTSAS